MKGADWLSERILFGGLLIIGYFVLVALALCAPVIAAVVVPAGEAPIVEQAISAGAATVKDALLVIGPLLGMIVQAIWKTDRADKQTAETVDKLAAAVNTAMSMPAAPQ